MRRLILRPGAIGDCLLSWPALEYLVADYTEIWISPAVVPLVQFAHKVRSLSATGIDVVAVGDREMPVELRDLLKSFDSIVSWYGSNRPEFRAALEETGVPCQFLQALPPADYPGHATAFFARQVGAADSATRLKIGPADEKLEVVIHPFSGSKQKNWPFANFQKIAAKLAGKVEWLAGPEEELAGARRFDDLYDLARWMKSARLYIGNDSGITHLAAAIGVPTLALFGPTDPKHWAPRGDQVVVLREQPIGQLAPKRVLEAANRLLS